MSRTAFGTYTFVDKENHADGRNLFAELRTKGYETPPRSWEELTRVQGGILFYAD